MWAGIGLAPGGMRARGQGEALGGADGAARLEAGHGSEELEEGVRVRAVEAVARQVDGGEHGAVRQVADAVQRLELVAGNLQGRGVGRREG